MTTDEMKVALIGGLTPYLKKTGNFDEELLSFVVDGVLMDARQIRRYPSSYTEGMVERDMTSHIGVFRNVAIARYSKIGMESEQSHSEGEVSRSFQDAGKEWSGWLPIATV